jgi:hypothetical protein
VDLAQGDYVTHTHILEAGHSQHVARGQKISSARKRCDDVLKRLRTNEIERRGRRRRLCV